MGVVVSLASALALMLGASPAAASTPLRTGAPVVAHVSQSPASAKRYWTRGRMRSAQPTRLLAPRAAASRSPHTLRPAAARHALAAPVRKLRRYPNRTGGKVFFSDDLGDRYECSGTAVRSRSRNLVLTAAHCSYLTGLLGGSNVLRNWIFVPAYAHGSAPFGKWAAVSQAAPAGWIDSGPSIGPGGEIIGGDSRFDLGAVTVGANAGRSLEKRVGGRKVAFRRPRRHRYIAFGYPAEGRYSGQREFSCSSPYGGADNAFGSPPPIRIRCDMTAGASGGGWIDRRGRLVSVTSYGYSNDARSLYGPYFGIALRDFFGSVSG